MNFIGLSSPCRLPDTNLSDYPEMPHGVVADDAFPQEVYMWKPYPDRTTSLMARKWMIYNYR